MIFGVQEGTESPPSRFDNYTAIEPVSSFFNVTTPLIWHSLLDTPEQFARVQFAHKTIVPNATRIIEIYHAWRASLTMVSDIEGFGGSMVLNTMPKSAASVGLNNGVGNVWGLDDTQSLISKFSPSIHSSYEFNLIHLF
jgi:hypothetical protein